MGFSLKKIGRKIERKIRKPLKAIAIAAAVYYTGGAALALYAKSRQQAQGPQEPQFVNVPYSAPFNPGYSYTGPPESYGGAAFSASGGTGGAAIPSLMGDSNNAPTSSGFTITPMMGILALVVILFGFLFLRR
jgi:fucose permease